MISEKELSSFQATDREQCGILIESPKGIRIAEVENVHPSPESYAVRMSDVETTKGRLKKHEKVIGFFHTHLSHHRSDPSDDDFDGALLLAPGMQNCVYQPATGSLIWYASMTEVETNT